MTLVSAVLPGRPVRNGLTWKPYRYNGTGVDVLTPHLDDPEPVPPAAHPEPCYCDGTMRDYRKHLAKGEKPCQASRDDINLYERNRAAWKRENKCPGCGYQRGSVNHRTLCGGAA